METTQTQTIEEIIEALNAWNAYLDSGIPLRHTPARNSQHRLLQTACSKAMETLNAWTTLSHSEDGVYILESPTGEQVRYWYQGGREQVERVEALEESPMPTTAMVQAHHRVVQRALRANDIEYGTSEYRDWDSGAVLLKRYWATVDMPWCPTLGQPGGCECEAHLNPYQVFTVALETGPDEERSA